MQLLLKGAVIKKEFYEIQLIIIPNLVKSLKVTTVEALKSIITSEMWS